MNFDRTFCASPYCKNRCSRKMPDEIKELLRQKPYLTVSYAAFCDDDGNVIKYNAVKKRK